MIAVLLAEAWPYIATVGAFVAAYFFGRVQGANKEKVKHIEDTLDAVGKVREAQDAVESDSDMAVRDRARKRMREQQGR